MKSTAPYVNHGLPTVQWVEVTPELAREWLTEHNINNRNARPGQIAAITRDLENHAFLVTGQTILFDWNGRLIDGQHRLNAIVRSGVAATILVVTKLDPEVQVVIDAGAKRNGADSLKFKDLGSHHALIAAAARIGATYEAGKLTTSASRANAAMTNSETVAWVLENPGIVDAGVTADKLRRAIPARPAVLGYAVHVLTQIDAYACAEFFESIRYMRTSGKGDPRLALSRYLESVHMGAGHPEARASFELFAIFLAWNAWRDGRTLLKIDPYSRTKDERGNRIPRAMPTPH